jgi:hypothetical protein
MYMFLTGTNIKYYIGVEVLGKMWWMGINSTYNVIFCKLLGVVINREQVFLNLQSVYHYLLVR